MEVFSKISKEKITMRLMGREIRYYRDLRLKGTSYKQQKQGRIT
jgi:hypothetical protein